MKIERTFAEIGRGVGRLNRNGGAWLETHVGPLTKHSVVGAYLLTGLVIGAIELERHSRAQTPHDTTPHIRMLDSERRIAFAPKG